MCDKCVELDRKIEHYHRLASRFTDRALLDGIRELIERAEVQKAALHPERPQAAVAVIRPLPPHSFLTAPITMARWSDDGRTSTSRAV